MTTQPDIDHNQKPTPKKSVWPWLLLLVLTVAAIYSYDRASVFLAHVESNLPDIVIDMLGYLFDELGLDRQPPGGYRI